MSKPYRVLSVWAWLLTLSGVVMTVLGIVFLAVQTTSGDLGGPGTASIAAMTFGGVVLLVLAALAQALGRVGDIADRTQKLIEQLRDEPAEGEEPEQTQ